MMATKQIVDNLTINVIDTPQVLYTAPVGQDVVIESFTASNTSSVCRWKLNSKCT